MSRFVRWAYRASAATLGHLGLKDAVRAQILPKLVAAAAGSQTLQDGPHGPAVAVAQRHLERLAASDKPILVGPWVSEIGFELLYWIPFVRWATRSFGLDRSRLVAVTRGGAGAWYGPDCARSVELLELFTPKAFRDGNLGRWVEAKGQKQGFATAFETTCLDRAAESLGLVPGAYDVLSPNLMHNIFWFVWNGKAPLELLEAHGVFDPLPAPEPAEIPGLDSGLPKDFVAVRFYSRESFPDNPENRQFLDRLLDRLASQTEVVLLNPDLALDDHDDFKLASRPGVHRIGGQADPATNLALQSQAIADARLFVGTYGGLAYLAPFLGVPSISFYSDPSSLKPIHGELASRTFEKLGAPFLRSSVEDYELFGKFGL